MAYFLKLPLSIKQLYPVFNVIKLTPILDDLISGRWMNPPILINGQEKWKIEEILDSH